MTNFFGSDSPPFGIQPLAPQNRPTTGGVIQPGKASAPQSSPFSQGMDALTKALQQKRGQRQPYAGGPSSYYTPPMAGQSGFGNSGGAQNVQWAGGNYGQAAAGGPGAAGAPGGTPAVPTPPPRPATLSSPGPAVSGRAAAVTPPAAPNAGGVPMPPVRPPGMGPSPNQMGPEGAAGPPPDLSGAGAGGQMGPEGPAGVPGGPVPMQMGPEGGPPAPNVPTTGASPYGALAPPPGGWGMGGQGGPMAGGNFIGGGGMPGAPPPPNPGAMGSIFGLPINPMGY